MSDCQVGTLNNCQYLHSIVRNVDKIPEEVNNYSGEIGTINCVSNGDTRGKIIYQRCRNSSIHLLKS